MADDVATTRTKAIVRVPLKSIRLEGWEDYVKKSRAFSKAKEEAKDAKEQMRETLKSKLVQAGKIGPNDEIDFTTDQAHLTVYPASEKREGRRRIPELVL